MTVDARNYPMSDLPEGDYIGTVEAVGFTSGGMGNQWTVIDGKRYVTYWNALTTDWRVGDSVRFAVRSRSFGYSNHGTPPSMPHAQQIHRIVKNLNGWWVLEPREKSK